MCCGSVVVALFPHTLEGGSKHLSGSLGLRRLDCVAALLCSSVALASGFTT
jgi:hypothetical protein